MINSQKAGAVLFAWAIMAWAGGAAAEGAAAQALDTQIPEIRAQLSPRDFTTLAAEIGVKVEKISAREGDHFKKGQVLITFDCSVQRAQLAEARAGLVAAGRTATINRRLLELKSIGKLETDVADAEADKARARLAAVAAVVAKCSVSAPFDGRVVEQKVWSQQFVQPGQALLDILDDSALELEFVVPSKWLTWLKSGFDFQVAIDETAKVYPAKLTRLGARIDPVSQTIKIIGTISGHFPELTVGMSGRVKLAPP